MSCLLMALIIRSTLTVYRVVGFDKLVVKLVALKNVIWHFSQMDIINTECVSNRREILTR